MTIGRGSTGRCRGWLSHERVATTLIALLGLSGVAWWPGGVAAGANQKQEESISKPGQYQGYSEAVFDGWQRTSQYVTMRDGTKIAVDILRPRRGARGTASLCRSSGSTAGTTGLSSIPAARSSRSWIARTIPCGR